MTQHTAEKSEQKAAQKAEQKAAKQQEHQNGREDEKVELTKKKLADVMKKIDICMLTTVDANGRLVSRPMSNNRNVAFDGDTWFFSFADSTQVQQVQANPNVNLAYSVPIKIIFVSLEGTAEIVHDDAKKKELWRKELAHWFENGPDDDNIVLIKVSARHATYWGKDGEGELEL